MEVMKSLNSAVNLYTVSAVIAYLCVWWVVNYVWMRPRRVGRWLRAQGFQGNPYRLWYGDTKDLTRMTLAAQSKPIKSEDDIAPYALPFHHHLLQKYGKRSFIWNGPNPRILIMEPDVIEDIWQKHEVFRKVFTNPLNRLLATGITGYEGDKWAKHRRIVNTAFTIAKLKDMVPPMLASCSQLVEKWKSILSDKGSHEVDVWPVIANFTADVISRTAFGSNYEEGEKMFLLQRELAELVVQLSRSVYVPGFRDLPTKTNRRMREINREVQDIIRGIVQGREEAMRVGSEQNKSNDLLGILLESNSEEIKENGNRKEVGITMEEVIEECKIFYLAGQETTSNLLVWTMVMLSIHQNWQVQAREEVFQVFGKSNPDFEGLHQLKKMNMILHEVLRLHSPAPAMLRVVHEKTQVGDIYLPRGVEIVLPAILVHHDKEIWGEDAKEFKPERFAQGVAKAAKGHLAAIFPFGLGPRICVGQNFSMVEAKLALAMILQHFSFELSPSYERGPVPVITLKPKFGAKILLSKI